MSERIDTEPRSASFHANFDEYLGGSTEPWTVSVLEAFVRLLRPKRILELGTFEGRTTRRIAKAMDFDAQIATVDIEQRHTGFLDKRIAWFERDAIEFLLEPPIDSFDLVFVDDDHEKEHVAEELDLLVDGIVAPGGVILVHDVIGPFGLDELVLERGGFIIDLPLLHAAGGLGVIQC